VEVTFSPMWKALEIQDFWDEGRTTERDQVGWRSLRVLYQGRMKGEEDSAGRLGSRIKRVPGGPWG
jgi:hypothetical protein